MATRPVTAATADFQSAQPSGVKIQAIALPIAARMELSMSTMPNWPSCIPKEEVNQTAMVDRRMIEPAFFTKEEPRSYMDFRMSIGLGRWYAGSSITNGAGSPANHFVFFSTIPEKMMAAMPRK